MRKHLLTIAALIALFALVLSGCGGKPELETATMPTASTEVPALGLADFSLSTTTWSSPNGATVHLTAAPIGYAEGYSAAFVVRLEGDEVANIPCQWDGKNYTADAELNAADGLCYYVLMTAADGSTAEVPVNTPGESTDEALINMASALESYCNLMVEATAFADSKLTVTAGSVQVQAPRITNEGQAITVSKATLVLSFAGEEVDRQEVTLENGEGAGAYQTALNDVSFQVPALENDQQLTLTLHVELSNGQSLSAAGGTFFYNDGELLTAVG